MNVTMHTFSINADPLAVCLSVTGITTNGKVKYIHNKFVYQ